MEGQSQKRRVRLPEANVGESERNSEGSTECVNHRTSGEEHTINNQSWLMEWLVSKEQELVSLFQIVRKG